MLREDGSDLLREEAISPFQPIAPTTSNWQDAPTPPSANWTRI
jgi:hypothetical protein